MSLLMCLCSYPVPTAPMLLSVSPDDQTRNLTATWSAPTMTNGMITEYILRYSPTDEESEEREEGITETEFTVTGLVPYTNYTVSVQACTSEGCGPFSNEISAETLQEGTVLNAMCLKCSMCMKGVLSWP